jgi:Domain of unknown function (DUF2383)
MVINGEKVDVATLNDLLRGEMAAIETYRLAIEKTGDAPGTSQLHTLQRSHRDAADALWHHVEELGAGPPTGSGAWGAFAKAVEGAATLFGNAMALQALREGEERGVGQYREALAHRDLPAGSRALVRSLLARQQEHLAALDRLIARLHR